MRTPTSDPTTAIPPGRFAGRIACPACRAAWADGTPMATVTAFEGYGVARDRGIIAARCLLCGRTWRGLPEGAEA